MKTSQHGARHSRRLLFGLFVFGAALMLLVITSVGVFADSVNIVDNAHVLDVAQVTQDAFQLPNPVNIYTTSTFAGTTAAFDEATTKYIGPNDSNLIVINIDTARRHLAIVGGAQVPLSNDQYASAIQTFKDNVNNGDYTGATVAALQSLNTALAPQPDTNGMYPGGQGVYPGGQVDPGQMQTFTSPGSDFSPAIPFIFSVFAIVFVVFIMRTIVRSAVGGSGRSTVARNALPRDVTPWEAGALGTAAGGMVGYDVEREGMERQNRERIQQQMFNNNSPGADAGNSFGGGNIGGGAGGDFGGGNMGGGGNIGGGSSGNF
jgi:uncharacterized membrane protein YgcG